MTKVSVARKFVVALLIVAVVLPFVGTTVSAAPPASGCFFYTVRWGDSLSSIAWRFGDSVWDLAARNGISNPNYIRAGMCLKVCGGEWHAPTPVCHKVCWGESLWSIANMYGTTPWAIASLNGIFNLNQIYAGQVLRIR